MKLYELVAGETELLWLLSVDQDQTVHGKWANGDEGKQWDEVNEAILQLQVARGPTNRRPMALEMGTLRGYSRGDSKWRTPRDTADYYPRMIPPRCDDTITLWIKRDPEIITVRRNPEGRPTHEIYLLAVIGYRDDRGFGLLCRQQQIRQQKNCRWRVFHFHHPSNPLVASSLVPRLHSCLSYYEKTIRLATDPGSLARIESELQSLSETIEMIDSLKREYERLEMQSAAIDAITRSQITESLHYAPWGCIRNTVT